MNWRRITDSEIITELSRRGYVVRRNHAARAITVTTGDPMPPGWHSAALDEIKQRITMEHIDFEKGTSANEIEFNSASLRIL
jgi:hypothetical protein